MVAKQRKRDVRADERCFAYGKGVWSWHPLADAKHADDQFAGDGD
jgi:hypothetical protein